MRGKLFIFSHFLWWWCGWCARRVMFFIISKENKRKAKILICSQNEKCWISFVERQEEEGNERTLRRQLLNSAVCNGKVNIFNFAMRWKSSYRRVFHWKISWVKYVNLIKCEISFFFAEGWKIIFLFSKNFPVDSIWFIRGKKITVCSRKVIKITRWGRKVIKINF